MSKFSDAFVVHELGAAIRGNHTGDILKHAPAYAQMGEGKLAELTLTVIVDALGSMKHGDPHQKAAIDFIVDFADAGMKINPVRTFYALRSAADRVSPFGDPTDRHQADQLVATILRLAPVVAEVNRETVLMVTCSTIMTTREYSPQEHALTNCWHKNAIILAATDPQLARQNAQFARSNNSLRGRPIREVAKAFL